MSTFPTTLFQSERDETEQRAEQAYWAELDMRSGYADYLERQAELLEDEGEDEGECDA